MLNIFTVTNDPSIENNDLQINYLQKLFHTYITFNVKKTQVNEQLEFDQNKFRLEYLTQHFISQ